MSAESAVAVAPTPAPAIEVSYQLTVRDVFRAACEGSRYSRIMLVLGFVGAWGSVLGIVTGDVPSYLGLVFVIAFVTGLIPGLVAALLMRQRRDLLARETWLQADGSGIRMRAAGSSSEADWSLFRRIREMSSDILLDFGTGASMIVPKRAMTSTQLIAFRELARTAGKWESSSSWRMPVLGVGLGVLTVGAFVVLTGGLSPT